MAILPVVLASASPRRKELLGHIVGNFTVEPAFVDETPLANEGPTDIVRRLSINKTLNVANKHLNSLVIGSDTIVAVDKTILGKPLDYEDFLHKMQLLSNRKHNVYTGVCICDASSAKALYLDEVVVTEVTMAEISTEEALAYWQTNEPLDKAGGYAIQGIGGKFVKSIKGSYSAVVGLPLFETQRLIKKITE